VASRLFSAIPIYKWPSRRFVDDAICVVPLAGAMSSPHYTALPSGEKTDLVSADEVVPPSPAWKKLFLIVAGLVLLFLLASLVVTDVSSNVIPSTPIENVSMHGRLLPKAAITGDQYLLGVGKADITGLVVGPLHLP
jgi:hypothetical protein